MSIRVYKTNPQKKRNILSTFSITAILLLINLLAFIFFLIILSTNFISLDSIAIKPSNILQGKYLWTFITSMFMHANFIHIFVNMVTLFFIGSLVEKILGPKRYFFFYLISGLFAGLFFVLISLLFTTDLNTYAVGASGALFGLIGLLVLLTPDLPVYAMFIPIPIKIKYAGPGFLILLWFISAAPLVIGGEKLPIGNTAHLGGLLAGLFYGFYLRNKYPNKLRKIRNYFR